MEDEASLTLQTSEIMNLFRAVDYKPPEAVVKKLEKAGQLEDFYYNLAGLVIAQDHKDDRQFAHGWMSSFYGMRACPFCRAKLLVGNNCKVLEALR